MQAMSEHGDMGCDKFADMAAELALGVLTGRERADALAHLERCDACRETVRQLTMTGEQLLGLLPAVEPPAGFESRAMARLGITVPDVPQPAVLGKASSRGGDQFAQGGDRAGGQEGNQFGDQASGQGDGEAASPALRRRRTYRVVKVSPPGHARTAGRPVSGRGTGRRTLAMLATALAVVVAALGGWGMHDVTSPAQQSALSSATLLSVTRQNVGQIYYYNSSTHWIYMTVDMPSGDGMITCELEGPNGYYTAVGKLRLTQGYGAWGSPARWSDGKVAGARLLSSNGTVIATATFS
jgi:hypothetical protein